MSLQGTFDTLSVAELFGLLATAAKTGALRLVAGDHEASVFVTGGLCCAVESDGSHRPVGSDAELAGRLVDIGFAFARNPAGSFRFSDSELAGHDTGVTTPLEPAVVEIQSLLDQWHEIEVTIPSLDVRVRLAPVLRDEQIVVNAQEWGLLVALEGMPTVRELVDRRGQQMISVCRDLKGLVDRGAVEVGAEVALPDIPTELGHDHRNGGGAPATSLLEPSEPYAPESCAPHSSAAGASAPEAGDLVAAQAEADAVAAGILNHMTRSRRPVPDVFAGSAESPADPADITVSVQPVTSEALAAPAPVGDADEPAPDRGALLRLFSALKE